jgi:hypothetical protein
MRLARPTSLAIPSLKQGEGQTELDPLRESPLPLFRRRDANLVQVAYVVRTKSNAYPKRASSSAAISCSRWESCHVVVR